MTNVAEIAQELENYFDEESPSDEQYQCIQIAFAGTKGTDEDTLDRILELKMYSNSAQITRMLNDWQVEGF